MEDGYGGQTQDIPFCGNLWATRIPTDDELTVKDDISDIFGGPRPKPLLKVSGNLYYVLRLTRLEGEAPRIAGTQKRVGSDLISNVFRVVLWV